MLKKGAYDLGRKSVYYILVIVVLFFVFVYVNNAVSEYQVKDLQALEKLSYLSEINKVKSCFYYKYPLSERVYRDINIIKFNDKDILKDCYGKPAKVTLLNRFGDELFEGKLEFSVENTENYGGYFYKIKELVTARKGHNVAPAILQIEIAIYEDDELISGLSGGGGAS